MANRVGGSANRNPAASPQCGDSLALTVYEGVRLSDDSKTISAERDHKSPQPAPLWECDRLHCREHAPG